MYTTACISDKSKDDRPETESIEILPEGVFSVVDDRPLDFFIESRGIVEPIQNIQLTPRISGFIDHQIIQDGSKVKKGAVLIQFNEQEWELQKKKLTISI